MITKQDLLEAIAECQGERNPDAKTCIKLSAYYTILDHIDPDSSISSTSHPDYSLSYAPPTASSILSYTSGTEFAQAIDGKDTNAVLSVLDEAFDALQTFTPKIYDVIIGKLLHI